MLKQWQFLTLTALAVISLALAIVNIVLVNGNREGQNDYTRRAQYIQQSLQLEPLYQGIVRNLAEIAAKTNDPQIARILTSQGITYTINQPQAGAASDAKGKGK